MRDVARDDVSADAILAPADAELSVLPDEPVTAAAVPAMPTPAGLPAVHLAQSELPGPAQVVPGDTQTVRVHIGRLEVRANLLDATPSPQPRPAPPAPQGLSLADYLRGKRGPA